MCNNIEINSLPHLELDCTSNRTFVKSNIKPIEVVTNLIPEGGSLALYSNLNLNVYIYYIFC